MKHITEASDEDLMTFIPEWMVDRLRSNFDFSPSVPALAAEETKPETNVYYDALVAQANIRLPLLPPEAWATAMIAELAAAVETLSTRPSSAGAFERDNRELSEAIAGTLREHELSLTGSTLTTECVCGVVITDEDENDWDRHMADIALATLRTVASLTASEVQSK